MGFLHDVKDKRLTADEVARCRELPLFGAGIVTTSTDGANGTTVDATTWRVPEGWMVGMIAENGGSPGIPDYPDERYFAQFSVAAADFEDERLEPLADLGNFEQGIDDVRTVHNLAEWTPDGGTHTLPVGRLVLVFRWVDEDGGERLVMSEGGSFSVSYGKLASDWDGTSNAVTLTPVVSDTDATVKTDGAGAPLPNVTCKIQFPTGLGAGNLDADVGDILAYVTAGDLNVLFNPPLIPRGGSQYMVLQRSATNGPMVFDWTRAH